MPSSLQLNLPPTPVESVSRDGAMRRPDVREAPRPESGEKVSLTAILAASCRAVGLQEKDAARSQGYTPKYWPRIKSGEKRAYLDPIADLPESAQREFVARYAKQLKMHVSDEDARKAVMVNLIKAAAAAIEEVG